LREWAGWVKQIYPFAFLFSTCFRRFAPPAEADGRNSKTEKFSHFFDFARAGFF
jgi:hypothetical protein